MSTSKWPLKVGIVGFGSFAQFLAETMASQGHILRATSRSDYSQLCAQLGITFFRNIAELLQADNDVILLCTSILSLAQVLNSMPFRKMLNPSTLFVDVLSVKEYPRDLLLGVLPKEADILCTHPMFGPHSGKDGWKDLRFVYDRVRISDETRCSNFLQIFESEGCKMLEMSCEEHDKMAANSQFVSHAIGRLLSELDVKSTPIDTKSYESLVQLKENTVKDSFELFSGLFIHNKYARGELKNLELALGRVGQSLFGRMDESADHQKGVRSFSNPKLLKRRDHQNANEADLKEVAKLPNTEHQNLVRNQNSKNKEPIKAQMQLTFHRPCTRTQARPPPRHAIRPATGLTTSGWLPLKQTCLAYQPF